MKLLEMMDALGSPFDRDAAAMEVSAALAMGAGGAHGGAGFTQVVNNPMGGQTVYQDGVVVGGFRPSTLGGLDMVDGLGMPTGHIDEADKAAAVQAGHKLLNDLLAFNEAAGGLRVEDGDGM